MPSLATNWAGNHTYRAAGIVGPTSLEELGALVAGASKVRALGSRHSFSDLTDTEGTLVDLAGLPADIRVDPGSATVSLGGGVRYGELSRALEEHGWALANLASLPHISVAGAVATGTHGSGDRNGSLATAVASLELMGPDGQCRRVARGDAEFEGSVVALGALGIVTRLELDIEPSYLVRQEVRTGLTWAAVEDHFDDITAAGYSVSLFTRFDEQTVDQLWVKCRADQPPVGDLFDTRPAGAATHMISGGAVQALTTQGGVAGPWLDRLPHFRMEFTPSAGEELQSEYFVPREHAVSAIGALRGIAPSLRPLLHVAEIRTVAPDRHWLSGAHERDTVAFHFTWLRDEPAVRTLVREVERVLAPFAARPHWGKVFEMQAAALAQVFPRLADFAGLRHRVDPDGVFGNAFLQRVLPDPAQPALPRRAAGKSGP